MRMSFLKLYLYHIDGSKTQTTLGAFSLDDNKQLNFNVIRPEDISVDIWRWFINRIDKIMSTMILSIYTLKKEVDKLTVKLKKYEAGKIDVMLLLGFEENDILTTINVICILYANKDKYEMTKTFNQNLSKILNLDTAFIKRTKKDKIEFIKLLKKMDKEKKLSGYIWNGIKFLNKIYEKEIKKR